MARRYLGYGTTNSQGIATLEYDPNDQPINGYTGVGAGVVDIIATSGTLESEAYELLDCIVLDENTTNTSSNYYIQSADGTSKDYDSTNKRIAVTCGSNVNRNYIYYRTNENSGLLDKLKGQRVIFEVDVAGLNGKPITVSIRQVVSGSNVDNTGISTTSDTTLVSNAAEINPNATSVAFRIDATNTVGWVNGDTYYIKNLKIYPI